MQQSPLKLLREWAGEPKELLLSVYIGLLSAQESLEIKKGHTNQYVNRNQNDAQTVQLVAGLVSLTVDGFDDK